MYLLLLLVSVLFYTPCAMSQSSSSRVYFSDSCREDELLCNSTSECVSLTLVCDGNEDCSDGSDEFNCRPTEEPIVTEISKFITEYVSCEENEFKCKNVYECVHSSLVCDGKEDCSDGSDEFDCTKSTELPRQSTFPYVTTPTCKENEFTCLITRDCINLSLVCDGYYDCTYRTDEFNCIRSTVTEATKQYTPYVTVTEATKQYTQNNCANDPFQYVCPDGKCIDIESVCNGVRDCDDGSDEFSCPTPIGGDYTTVEPGPCNPDPCGLWGVCSSNFLIQLFHEDEFKCDCYGGHKGKFCEIDFCQLGCQNNGDCKVSFWSNKPYCDCVEGYGGDHCEKDLCDQFCFNSGECLISSWTHKPYCNCQSGYDGDRCDEDLCDCSNNGECKFGLFGASCDCDTGYSGKHCENDLCAHLNCQNNGECKSGFLNILYCDCPRGYYGKRCQHRHIVIHG
ncbi:uncharacterized protein [Antedon mediterranea]|uniref:uncharacterized protein isoform X2 n=1 Tax=Antedon mediterranea TaxID=105859 RepID=UPI003AF66656